MHNKYYRLRVVPHVFLRDSRASKTRARVKIKPREKRRHAAGREKCRLFSRGLIFTRARVLLALLSLRKNGGLLVVYKYYVHFFVCAW